MAYTSINKSDEYFNTKLYTGDDTSGRSITGINFQPDLVWLKKRNGIESHTLFDSVRGATKFISSDTTSTESTNSEYLQSFDSDGFTVGNSGYVNSSANNYVAWNWLAGNGTSSNTDGSITSTVSANTTSGFSIVSYTGTGSNATVGHGLGATPKVLIVKKTNATSAWEIFHSSIPNMNTSYMEFTTNPVNSLSTIWGGTNPTSSTFHVGTDGSTNGSSNNYIAYCFAEKKGFSKFGSYTGNASTDGTFIFTGFKPAFVMTKSSSNTGTPWNILDNKRDGYNATEKNLQANTVNVEDTGRYIDFLSNGFKLRNGGTEMNGSGYTYIYMAFAEHPLVSSTGTPCTAR